MGADPAEVEPLIRAAWDDGRWDDAATIAIDRYGPELMGYLIGMARDETTASDAFALCCENLWKALPKFRWESACRTWAYTLARRAFTRIKRDPHARRAVPLSAVMSAAIAQVQSRTATFLRTETKDKIAELRARLDPDDQSLLILRINRKLAWREIATILADDSETDAAAITRKAAALRKRFERLKDELRTLAKP